MVVPAAYGGDTRTGAAMATISHAACIITIPLLYALLLGPVIAPVVYLAVCLVLLIIVCALMRRYLAHGGSTRFARLQSD